MKLLKFKDFSYHSDINEIYLDVEDIFYSLRDYGFEVEVEQYTYSNSDNQKDYIEEEISFKILKSDKSKFIIESDDSESEELKDCILRSKKIMNDWNLQMEVKFKFKDGGYNPLLSKDVKLNGDNFVYVKSLQFDEEDEYGFDYDENLVDMPILLLRVFFTRKINVE